MPWPPLLNHLNGAVRRQLQPVRSRLLQDPYYRFQSMEEVALAAELGLGIDVNRAEIDDWLRLPGVSIHQARALVSLRQAGVQFHCLEDLAAALNLSPHRLQPLAPILRFCYYDPQSPSCQPSIPINTASAEMLVRIPAVDLFLARAIVQNRTRRGNYRNLADLQQRLQLPVALTEALLHYISF